MIQLLILYYLSLKPTHGYEIQKFVQLNHMGEWNNIKSGSIYYAMNKLEKDKMIELVEKVGDAEKTKRIYSITEKGRKNLKELSLKEINKSLGSISSEKFLIYPVIANLKKEEILSSIEGHIDDLKKKLKQIEKWILEKNERDSKVEMATLKMMKNTVLNQIAWHKTLSDNIDETIEMTNEISDLIIHNDFSQ